MKAVAQGKITRSIAIFLKVRAVRGRQRSPACLQSQASPGKLADHHNSGRALDGKAHRRKENNPITFSGPPIRIHPDGTQSATRTSKRAARSRPMLGFVRGLSGKMEITNTARLDDQSVAGRARIERGEVHTLTPGVVYAYLPGTSIRRLLMKLRSFFAF